MKNLLKINKYVYIVLFILIIFFLATLVLLFTFKVEDSKIVMLQVQNEGKKTILVDGKTLLELQEAKKIYLEVNHHKYLINIKSINFNNDKPNNIFKVEIKGVKYLLPGMKFKATLIMGYKPLINTIISSGV